MIQTHLEQFLAFLTENGFGIFFIFGFAFLISSLSLLSSRPWIRFIFYSFFIIVFWVFISVALLFFFEKFIGPVEYGGFVLFYLGGIITLFLWTLFARKKLKIKWKFIPLTVALPIAYIVTTFTLNSMLHDYDVKNFRPERYSDHYVKQDFASISKHLLQYKKNCGTYPDNLQVLLRENNKCWSRKDFQAMDYLPNYRTIKDPWQRYYIYTVLSDGKLELKTLGLDGLQGGERINKDQSYRF
jgi:hypothetical protein